MVATTLGWQRAMASATRSSGTTSPQGASTVSITAPMRVRISASSRPKRPKFTTSTTSPGATRLTSAASIPARAVPSTSMVHWFRVPKIGR
ncbi:hypothetical protein ADT71_20965 [Novosphingobium sp. ST904]|nr:hypothetical protein ADT71_20965 [Novosphingobium sp. ST904]